MDNKALNEFYDFCKTNIRNKREYLKMLVLGQIPQGEIQAKVSIQKKKRNKLTYQSFLEKAALTDFYIQVGNKGEGGWETVDEVTDFIEYDNMCEQNIVCAKTMLAILEKADV